ncbi:uncharacterized protein RAG0_14083 [Rhynchosporium agropyri]|uniref:Glycosyl hydrolase family 92 domain-containing protein n=1 Tax=Rhynchosporium agropyri TaxID=914238 RepID=A0A1E1LHS1_9HELO|nr:uncharacterized protein RAG0_14083 [Rhynchosporium agropyri]
MIGLYHITGQITLLIHSSWYGSMTIDLGTGKRLKVTSIGGDGNGDCNIYVQRLKVNGKPWTRDWLTWKDVFANNGTMDLYLVQILYNAQQDLSHQVQEVNP